MILIPADKDIETQVEHIRLGCKILTDAIFDLQKRMRKLEKIEGLRNYEVKEK